MPTKPIEPPPEVAKAFVTDMHVFFAEKNKIKADEIAARQKFLACIPPSPNLICGL